MSGTFQPAQWWDDMQVLAGKGPFMQLHVYLKRAGYEGKFPFPAETSVSTKQAVYERVRAAYQKELDRSGIFARYESVDGQQVLKPEAEWPKSGETGTPDDPCTFTYQWIRDGVVMGRLQ